MVSVIAICIITIIIALLVSIIAVPVTVAFPAVVIIDLLLPCHGHYIMSSNQQHNEHSSRANSNGNSLLVIKPHNPVELQGMGSQIGISWQSSAKPAAWFHGCTIPHHS